MSEKYTEQTLVGVMHPRGSYWECNRAEGWKYCDANEGPDCCCTTRRLVFKNRILAEMRPWQDGPRGHVIEIFDAR